MNWPRPTRLQLSPERRRESFEYKISVVVGLMYTGNEEKKRKKEGSTDIFHGDTNAATNIGWKVTFGP